MPLKEDKIALKNVFLDRRSRMLPCQKEMVVYLYKVQGASINSISKMFRVSKRTIQFILFPERLKKNKELRHDRGGSSIYYDKDTHRLAISSLREYKRKLFL